MPHVQRRKLNISLVIPFAIVALVFGTLIWKKMHDSRQVQPPPRINQPAATRKGVLFFATVDARLAREGRELESCAETAECVKDLLDELFSGPVGELYEVIPEGAALLSVGLEGDLAVVDISSSFATDLPSGSSAEMLAVYSIVNTVCFNYPQITRVWITVAGNGKTILRHLDLSEPLPPDYTLEREATPTGSAVLPGAPAPAATKGHP